jgi:uncharacterized coiled-coil protein SlyX
VAQAVQGGSVLGVVQGLAAVVQSGAAVKHAYDTHRMRVAMADMMGKFEDLKKSISSDQKDQKDAIEALSRVLAQNMQYQIEREEALSRMLAEHMRVVENLGAAAVQAEQVEQERRERETAWEATVDQAIRVARRRFEKKAGEDNQGVQYFNNVAVQQVKEAMMSFIRQPGPETAQVFLAFVLNRCGHSHPFLKTFKTYLTSGNGCKRRSAGWRLYMSVLDRTREEMNDFFEGVGTDWRIKAGVQSDFKRGDFDDAFKKGNPWFRAQQAANRGGTPAQPCASSSFDQPPPQAASGGANSTHPSSDHPPQQASSPDARTQVSLRSAVSHDGSADRRAPKRGRSD